MINYSFDAYTRQKIQYFKIMLHPPPPDHFNTKIHHSLQPTRAYLCMCVYFYTENVRLPMEGICEKNKYHLFDYENTYIIIIVVSDCGRFVIQFQRFPASNSFTYTKYAYHPRQYRLRNCCHCCSTLIKYIKPIV